MNKKQIIDKIVNDLPVSDMLGKMTKEEWYGWFEECWDKALGLYDVGCSSDLIVIELSDEELKIVTRQELEQMQKDAMEFDGFEGWIVKGILVK